MPDTEEEIITKKRKKYPKTTKKGTRDFNDEQKAAIIKRAEEIGIHKAAEEFESSWQAVAAIQREAIAAGILPPRPSKRNRSIGKSGLKLASLPTETINPVVEDPAAPIIEVSPVVEEKPVAPAVEGTKIPKYSSLEIENAILREKVSVLTQQLEKLRSAVSQLA